MFIFFAIKDLLVYTQNNWSGVRSQRRSRFKSEGYYHSATEPSP